MKKGFDSKLYLKLQRDKIKERIKMFDKLYLEFGGKLIDDYHAARVLPGFKPDIKIDLLKELKDICEVILCINANDIERNRMRADKNISYDVEVLRLIEFFRDNNIMINNVVITLYNNQQGVQKFINKLKDYKIKAYIHTFTKGYPTDVNTIVSEEGYGANPYIETTKPLVVVSAPGACSGKLATSLSQLYHEHKRGIQAGYAKFETFPVWDLPLKHPVNIAYEAATADIDDKNMIDYFHLEKYKIPAINYNRDLEIFPVLKDILYKITKKTIYYSPTDMGVNVIGKCIIDNTIVENASKEEIIRRYYKSLVDFKKGLVSKEVPERIKILMNELNLNELDRKVVLKAREKKEISKHPSACISIGNKYILGRETSLLSPISSTILNAIKTLTKIPDDVKLLSPKTLEPIINLKNNTYNFKENTLKLNEVLLALSICSVTNPIIAKSLENLNKLKGSELHATYIIPDSELTILNNLGINTTCDSEPNIN